MANFSLPGARQMKRHAQLVMAVLYLFLCARISAQEPSDRAAVNQATKVIRPGEIRAHMRLLSDSLLEGRAPGTRGYDIAARYVATELEGMGLDPAVVGGWYQSVPLEKAVTDAAASSLSLTVDGKDQRLTDAKDYVLFTSFSSPATSNGSTAESDVRASVVFVGFGVTDPDRKYDDYAGIDARGKIVAVIYGAPSAFPSTERAYYSDSVVKSKIALAHGAIGALQISLPEDWKRFPWDWLVPQIQMGEMHWLDRNGIPHDSYPGLRGQALLSEQGAKLLFEGAPKSLDQLFADARASKPQAFALPVSAHIHTVANQNIVHSYNIIAEIRGSDPAVRDQYLVYTAHLDHLGICPPIDGDNVCHGALDNGSGVAAGLEIARAFSSLPTPPRRSILFVFVTGEEMGLLGSDYFAHYPTVPLKSIVANINMDGVPGSFFPMKDVVGLGAEHSSIGNDLAAAVKIMGLEVTADPMPEEVFFIRGDQYSFVLQGVPAVALSDAHSSDPKIDGIAVSKKWAITRYHTPLDNMDQPLDFDSMTKGTIINFLVGYRIAQDDAAPEWNKGDFFGTKFGPKHTSN